MNTALITTLNKHYVYAYMKHDEDTTNQGSKKFFMEGKQ